MPAIIKVLEQSAHVLRPPFEMILMPDKDVMQGLPVVLCAFFIITGNVKRVKRDSF